MNYNEKKESGLKFSIYFSKILYGRSTKQFHYITLFSIRFQCK